MKNKIIFRGFIILFSISVLVNIVFLKYDVFDYFKKGRLEKFDTYTSDLAHLDYNKLEETVVSKGLEMASSEKVEMIWNENTGLTATVLGYFSNRNENEFKKYNFPRAFLLYSLAEYYREGEKLKEVKDLFDGIIDSTGNPIFKLDKIDQIPFGLTSILLYEKFHEDKYLKFSNTLYDFLLKSVNNEGIITYRKGQKILYVDVLGMIVPFLTNYSVITSTQEPIKLAKKQISFFIENGLDKQDYLPVHGFDLRSKNDIGSTNWGRGIGWYYIALANMYKLDHSYSQELQGLHNSLMRIQNSDKLWSQFPGSSDVFDSSATTMFLYSERMSNNIDEQRRKAVLSNLVKYIDKEGTIMQSSGDTYSANNYSKSFGKSELSQAFLILYLASK